MCIIFGFFDFIDEFGYVNEDVFAYTNMAFGEKVLVFYNNSLKILPAKFTQVHQNLLVRVITNILNR
jgi:hypothetical protein